MGRSRLKPPEGAAALSIANRKNQSVDMFGSSDIVSGIERDQSHTKAELLELDNQLALDKVKDRSAGHRALACYELRTSKARGIANLLIRIAGDPTEPVDVRVASIGTLEVRRPQTALKPLIALLHFDSQVDVRWAAAYALGWFGTRGALNALIQTINDPDEDIKVVARAVEACGIVRSERALPAIVNLAQSEHVLLRFWVAYALGQIGNPSARSVLKRMVRYDNGVVDGLWSVKREAKHAMTFLRSD